MKIFQLVLPMKKIANGEDEDSSESESDDDSSEDQEEGDDESDEETPKKVRKDYKIEASNNTGIDSSKKTLVSVKKTKFVTPQKTNSKNVGYVATPHPSKQTGKPTLLITSSRLRSQEITAATLTTGTSIHT
ncbi:Histone deacetylase HDT1 [Glycine soja]|uniref:Histone deacetylase HDT1 n=1 Tax=Glycine soja TaxID=3848 RepID=A0A0B2R0Q3_GLYSO|nr:Histone deacetylase HDT1 [Glycine soja]